MDINAVLHARSVELDMIIIDEAHNFRNRNGKLAKNLKKLCNHQVNHNKCIVIPITGTPYVNFDYDIWTLLNFIDPVQFSSFWDFVKQYFDTSINRYQQQEINGVRDKEKFRKKMEDFIFVGDITDEFPEPNKYKVVGRDETGLIYSFVNDLREEGFAQAGDTFMDNSHHLSFLTAVRKLGVFPYLVSETLGLGWKVEWILENIKTMETPVLIGCCFPSGYPRLKEELEKVVKCPIHILDGGSGNQERTIADFKTVGGVLLCSVHIAEGFDLQNVRNVVILDKHWTHKTNEQFLGRVLRKGLQHTVNVYDLQDNNLGDAHVEGILKDKDRFNKYMDILSLNAKQNN
jgi:SNF2 family DNA or RNA helicase